MPRGLLWGFVVTLIVIIVSYTFMKYYHIDGSDTLAIMMSSLIAIIIAVQNAAIKKDIEKVKNQTNGMTHHIMEESKHLRNQIEREENGPTETFERRSRQPRERPVPNRTKSGGKYPKRREG